MLLKDIARKTGEPKSTDLKSILPADLSVHDLQENDLSGLGDTIYLLEDDGTVRKEIRRPLLEYLLKMREGTIALKILDMVDTAVVAVDRDGRIFYLNKAYENNLNVRPYKVLGKLIGEVEPGSLLHKVLVSHKPASNKMQKINSLNRYVSVQIFPLFAKGDFIGAVSFFNDITEIFHLNQKVEKMSDIVDEYSIQIQQFTGLQDLGIITRDKPFLDLISMAKTVAPTDVPVLITGENGVGKEVMANYIHQGSKRKNKPMITVNCAAIPADLMESELFGYEEGAFTGAAKGGRMGKFELADGGTIFLDEIGDMPVLMQSKLLRVLQQGEVEKIGRQKKIPVDVRVIAATNQPLTDMIKEKRFRQDLYFRINTITLPIPPLRKRSMDIPLLANHFLEEFNRKYSKKMVFSKATHEMMMAYTWPGNVRELRNYVERSVILSNALDLSGTAENKTYPEDRTIPAFANETEGTLSEQVREFEKQTIMRTMRECNNNRTEAMKKLGLSRRTFYRKCEGIDFVQE